jgi:large subunit ribosomal protein L4e
MKATLYTIEGKKKGEVEMPKEFDQKIREDIVKKYFEVDKFVQPYASDPKGGKKHSASGTISHKRHDWKGHYGKGIARVPRKTMWRRGVNFFWIGAEVSGTRGGRRAHPPKGIGKEKKINKKEIKIAMNSGLAATGNSNYITKRYSSIGKLDVKVPIVIESKLDNAKTKKMAVMLETVFEEAYKKGLILKNKKVRSGKGKLRGRKYKSNAGLLLVKGKEERIKLM